MSIALHGWSTVIGKDGCVHALGNKMLADFLYVGKYQSGIYLA